MAEREVVTKLRLDGVDDYVAELNKVAAAFNAITREVKAANEAIKEFDALSIKAPNSDESA